MANPENLCRTALLSWMRLRLPPDCEVPPRLGRRCFSIARGLGAAPAVPALLTRGGGSESEASHPRGRPPRCMLRCHLLGSGEFPSEAWPVRWCVEADEMATDLTPYQEHQRPRHQQEPRTHCQSTTQTTAPPATHKLAAPAASASPPSAAHHAPSARSHALCSLLAAPGSLPRRPSPPSRCIRRRRPIPPG